MQSKSTKLNINVWKSQKDLGKLCPCIGERVGEWGRVNRLRNKTVGILCIKWPKKEESVP